jgi:hypothetical protein
LFLFALILISAYFSLRMPVNTDEGVFFTSAKMVSNGAIPYRDFIDNKPPGIFWLLAPVFTVANSNIQAVYFARILLILINLLTTFILYSLSKKFFASSSLIIALLALFWVNFIMLNGYWFLTDQPMILFISLGILFFLRYYESLDPKILFFSGLSVGMAALFKPPALFAVLTMAIFLYIYKYNYKIKSPLAFVKNQFLLWLGFTMPYIIAAFYFFTNNSLHDFFYYAITVNILSYPPDSVQIFLLSYKEIFITLLPFWSLLFVAIVFSVKYPLAYLKMRWEIFFLMLLGFFLIPTFVRQYNHYFYPIIIFSIFPIGNLIDKLLKTGKIQRFFSTDLKDITPAGFLFVLISFPVITLLPKSFADYVLEINQNFAQYGLKQQVQTGNVIKSITTPEQKIYIFNNSAEYYLFSARKPANKNFNVSSFNTSSLNEIIESINKQKINYIFVDKNEKNPYNQKYFTTFYKFIDEKYKLSGEIGDLKVYKRIDDSIKETSVNQEK